MLATLLAVAQLPACASSTSETGETGQGVETGSETTSGGETGATGPGSSEGSEVTLAETLELPSTTLIPMPLSGVPRHQLSAELREVWRLAEEASAVPPPEFEGERTIEAVNAWATDVFTPWVQARGAQTRAAAEAAAALTQGSVELGVAGALVGYSYEEFVIMFRGAPIADSIAADPELLAIYVESITDASEPLARQSAAAYGVCARTLAPLGPESPWVEWAQYCLDRVTEVNEVYRLEDSAP